MEDTTRKFAIVTILVLVVALVSMDLNGLTGNVSADKAKSLTVTQEGVYLIVQVNPIGNSGMPGKWIDMRLVSGTKHADEQTGCDSKGAKSGTSQCYREIAVFDIRGSEWNAGNVVQFNIRGTNIKSAPYILK